MTETKHIRAAFLFTHPRGVTLERIANGLDSDTPLRGANYIPGADCIVVGKPNLWSRIKLVKELLQYDVVIAQDELLLSVIVSVCHNLFGTKTRWIHIAVNTSTLLQRHAGHPVRRFVLTYCWKQYARIVCLSKKQMEDLAQAGLSPDRLVFIPFGIDAEFFGHTSSAKPEIVVSVGRDAGRDYKTLCAAAAETQEQWIIVASHKNIPSDFSLPPNVTVKYNLSLAEIRELYGRAKCVVVVSEPEEVPTGSDCSGQMVTLDALAAGKAVVTTERSWIRDYFSSDKHLVVVPSKDARALKEAVEFLVKNQHQAQALGQAGKDIVKSSYTTRRFGEKLYTLLVSMSIMRT